MNPATVPTYEQLLQQVADLTAANEKLRKWKSIAREFPLDCCNTCEEFINDYNGARGYCNVCHEYYCSVCWEGSHIPMRNIIRTDPIYVSDPFDVCDKCRDVCGTCGNVEVEIICPKNNCKQSFCSANCYRKHCEKVDAERGLPAK